jgi:hypothetical protein
MADGTLQPVAEIELADSERDRIYRRNFIFFLADFVLFSVAFNLIGSTTVIPDFVRKLTGSEILIALSSQMFEILWLMPQLLVARRLVRGKKNVVCRRISSTRGDHLFGVILLVGRTFRSLLLFLVFTGCCRGR